MPAFCQTLASQTRRSSRPFQSSSANCADRAKTGLGSSNSYGQKIASTGYEGGTGLTSGDPRRTAFADFVSRASRPVPGSNGLAPPPQLVRAVRVGCAEIDGHANQT